MTNDLIITPSSEITPPAHNGALTAAGQAANRAAADHVFDDYRARKSDNTLRRHGADLARFATFLAGVGIQTGDLATDPGAWQGVTWGMVEAFRNWMLGQGDAINSINARLSTVKTYAGLAAKAGAITDQERALIKTVTGYSQTEGKRLNERRPQTRRGAKKAGAVRITELDAARLKDQPDTPQGRRDRVLITLLLDHGLRVGELAALRVGDLDLLTGRMTFDRPKVDIQQTHELTQDALDAIRAYNRAGDMPSDPQDRLLRGSRKRGDLTGPGMSERNITRRVRELGAAVGIDGLSAHDCRHFWATFWAGRVNPFQLKQAGGWSSMATVDRYVEASKIANEGMSGR